VVRSPLDEKHSTTVRRLEGDRGLGRRGWTGEFGGLQQLLFFHSLLGSGSFLAPQRMAFYEAFATLAARLADPQWRALHAQVNAGSGVRLVEALQRVLSECAEAKALADGVVVDEELTRVEGWAAPLPSRRVRRCRGGCERLLPLTHDHFDYDGKKHKAGKKCYRSRCKECRGLKKIGSKQPREDKEVGPRSGPQHVAATVAVDTSEEHGPPKKRSRVKEAHQVEPVVVPVRQEEELVAVQIVAVQEEPEEDRSPQHVAAVVDAPEEHGPSKRLRSEEVVQEPEAAVEVASTPAPLDEPSLQVPDRADEVEQASSKRARLEEDEEEPQLVIEEEGLQVDVAVADFVLAADEEEEVEEEEEEEEEGDRCCGCGKGKGLLYCCDGEGESCPNMYHYQCAGYARQPVESDEGWLLCPTCLAAADCTADEFLWQEEEEGALVTSWLQEHAAEWRLHTIKGDGLCIFRCVWTWLSANKERKRRAGVGSLRALIKAVAQHCMRLIQGLGDDAHGDMTRGEREKLWLGIAADPNTWRDKWFLPGAEMWAEGLRLLLPWLRVHKMTYSRTTGKMEDMPCSTEYGADGESDTETVHMLHRKPFYGSHYDLLFSV
jgi:hypothetical protein